MSHRTMTRPKGYKDIAVSGEVKESAEFVKDAYDITWNQFIVGCISTAIAEYDPKKLEPLIEKADIDMAHSLEEVEEDDFKQYRKQLEDQILD